MTENSKKEGTTPELQTDVDADNWGIVKGSVRRKTLPAICIKRQKCLCSMWL